MYQEKLQDLKQQLALLNQGEYHVFEMLELAIK